MEKLSKLRWLFLGFGIAAVVDGLWEVFAGCILAILAITIFLSIKTRPHLGKIKVDGEEVKFAYNSWGLAGTIQHSGITITPTVQVQFKAMTSPKVLPIELGDFAGGKEPDLPKVSANLEMHDGRVVEFVMYKESTRCPCPVNPPHWTGTAYAGKFIEDEDDPRLYGTVALIIFDQKKRKRYPIKWKLTLPQWFPRWRWMPQLEPSPARIPSLIQSI